MAIVAEPDLIVDDNFAAIEESIQEEPEQSLDADLNIDMESQEEDEPITEESIVEVAAAVEDEEMSALEDDVSLSTEQSLPSFVARPRASDEEPAYGSSKANAVIIVSSDEEEEDSNPVQQSHQQVSTHQRAIIKFQI